MALQELASALAPRPALPARPAPEPGLVPDLLHPIAMRRIDAEHTKLAIALAFASGVSGGVFAEALDDATVAPSTWEPATFASDLFLQQFVTLCFKVRIGGQEPTVSTSHQMLTRLAPQAFITTHFLAFAARLERERHIEGLRFLQVELGAEQRPTYQFTPGVAQTSLAGHAAARLGVTRDQLLSLVDRNTQQARTKGIAKPAAPRG